MGRLDRLITDISNASRLDAELARESSEPVDVAVLLRTLTSIYQDTQKEGDPAVHFHSHARPGEHEAYVIAGLEGQLGQVFRNLIANAISFSSADGSIEISLRKRNVKGSEEIWVTVDDQGPGIPDANLETIFNRFYSERPGHEEFGSNSGLGLSISRQIVEAHKGRIWAENQMDPTSGEVRGARFVVTFPSPSMRERQTS